MNLARGHAWLCCSGFVFYCTAVVVPLGIRRLENYCDGSSTFSDCVSSELLRDGREGRTPIRVITKELLH